MGKVPISWLEKGFLLSLGHIACGFFLVYPTLRKDTPLCSGNYLQPDLVHWAWFRGHQEDLSQNIEESKFISSRPMRRWDTRILKSMYFSLSLVWKIIDQLNSATNWEPFYLQNGGRHCLVELNLGCLCITSVHVSTGLQLWYRVSKYFIIWRLERRQRWKTVVWKVILTYW